MILGHLFLAFTLAALAGKLLDLEEEKILAMATTAAALALTPDIDVIYAVKEIIVLDSSGFYEFTDSFWNASQTTHRGVTHSLAALISISVILTVYQKIREEKAALSLSVIPITALVLGGVFSATVALLFVSTAFLATRKLAAKISYREFSVAAFTGLIIHPFGDLFTGTPPDLLYPLQVKFFGTRIMLNEDPVINLLAILSLELLLAWTAVKMYSSVRGGKLTGYIHPLCLLNLLYIFPASLIREPTLSSAYQLVFSLIVLSGGVTALVLLREYNFDRKVFRKSEFYLHTAVNLLAGLSLGPIIYLVYYLI